MLGKQINTQMKKKLSRENEKILVILSLKTIFFITLMKNQGYYGKFNPPKILKPTKGHPVETNKPKKKKKPTTKDG